MSTLKWVSKYFYIRKIWISQRMKFLKPVLMYTFKFGLKVSKVLFSGYWLKKSAIALSFIAFVEYKIIKCFLNRYFDIVIMLNNVDRFFQTKRNWYFSAWKIRRKMWLSRILFIPNTTKIMTPSAITRLMEMSQVKKFS